MRLKKQFQRWFMPGHVAYEEEDEKQYWTPKEKKVLQNRIGEALEIGKSIQAKDASNNKQIIVMEPLTFDDVEAIGTAIKMNQTLVIDMQGLKTDEARRILDFVSGVSYALDGTLQKVGKGEAIYIYTPKGIQVTGRDVVSPLSKE